MDDLDRMKANSGPDTERGPGTTPGFEFNHPTIISLLYLASCITGVTAIVGVVLAYVWRGEAGAVGNDRITSTRSTHSGSASSARSWACCSWSW